MMHSRFIKTAWKCLLGACLLLGPRTGVLAQDPAARGIPDEVYYLMPAFGQGTVYLRGQAPAQGQMNICALDNTLRFIDKDGTELAASNLDNLLKVRIDTVTFIRHDDAFLRQYPVSEDTGIAVRRDIKIIRDAKQGAYGTTSQTSAIRELGTLYTEGGSYELNKEREYPYRVSDVVFIYSGDSVMLPTKNSLRKLFPDKKDEVDAYFKSNRSFPDNVSDACALLSLWTGK